MFYKNVQKLIKEDCVYYTNQKVDLDILFESLELLEGVESDIETYIKFLMKGENYYYRVNLTPTFVITSKKSSKNQKCLSLTPHGVFSSNLMNRLKENPDNPVFLVSNYFSENLEKLKEMTQTTQNLTTSKLAKQHIVDIYGLYKWVGKAGVS